MHPERGHVFSLTTHDRLGVPPTSVLAAVNGTEQPDVELLTAWAALAATVSRPVSATQQDHDHTVE